MDVGEQLLQRLLSLSAQEAAEYQRARNLQLLDCSSEGALQAHAVMRDAAEAQAGLLPVAASSSSARCWLSSQPTCLSVPQKDAVVMAAPMPFGSVEALHLALQNAADLCTPAAALGQASQVAGSQLGDLQPTDSANQQGPLAPTKSLQQSVQVFNTPVQQLQQQCSGAEVGAQQATPPPPFLQANREPLMQRVLQQSAARVQASPLSKAGSMMGLAGSQPRKPGYQVDPDTLRRVVQQQHQRQNMKTAEGRQQRKREAGGSYSQPQQQLPEEQQQEQQQQPQQQCQSALLQQASSNLQPSAAAVFVADSSILQPLATDTTVASATAGILQLSGDLESLGTCMGLTAPGVAQPLELELDPIRMFGSAQKKLRLSICCDSPSSLPAMDLFTSPVPLPHPCLARSRVAIQQLQMTTPTGTAAKPSANSGVAAAFQIPCMDTPSKYLACSPVEVAATGQKDSANSSKPSAAVTPIRLFKDSPAKIGTAGHTLPETLVAHTPSPWARPLDPQQAETSLRSAARHGRDVASQPSSWVPVPIHGQAAAAAASSAATPASWAALQAGLHITPLAGAQGSISSLAGSGSVPTVMPIQQTMAVGTAAGRPSLSLFTPAVQEHQLQPTPVTAL